MAEEAAGVEALGVKMTIFLGEDTLCRVIKYVGDDRTVLVPSDHYHVYGIQDAGYRIRFRGEDIFVKNSDCGDPIW